MEKGEKRAEGVAAGLAVLALVLICGVVLWKFMGAFFVAVAGYIFLNPLYLRLRKLGFGKTACGWATLAAGALLIGVPGIIALKLVANEAMGLLEPGAAQEGVAALSQNLASLGKYMPAMDSEIVRENIVGLLMQAAAYAKELIAGWIGSIGELALGLLIVVFTFYYLLVAEGSLGKVREIIPFSRKNTDLLIKEFKSVLYSSIVVSGIMALVQAVPLTLVFLFFGVPGAVLLGVLAAVLTCIPFTGIPFVWIPVAAGELLGGNYAAGIGIIVAGIIIAVIENFRPMLQGKIGQIHPLVSLLGVIIGIVYFGVLGLFIGPILLSFALLAARMYKEEYL